MDDGKCCMKIKKSKTGTRALGAPTEAMRSVNESVALQRAKIN
jgi:hypothetical protein